MICNHNYKYFWNKWKEERPQQKNKKYKVEPNRKFRAEKPNEEDGKRKEKAIIDLHTEWTQ